MSFCNFFDALEKFFPFHRLALCSFWEFRHRGGSRQYLRNVREILPFLFSFSFWSRWIDGALCLHFALRQVVWGDWSGKFISFKEISLSEQNLRFKKYQNRFYDFPYFQYVESFHSRPVPHFHRSVNNFIFCFQFHRRY